MRFEQHIIILEKFVVGLPYALLRFEAYVFEEAERRVGVTVRKPFEAFLVEAYKHGVSHRYCVCAANAIVEKGHFAEKLGLVKPRDLVLRAVAGVLAYLHAAGDKHIYRGSVVVFLKNDLVLFGFVKRGEFEQFFYLRFG
ncbi:MAG: hypothetical protein ACD_47C00263G0001 [uncultured bacterium]|nr:MAG: hypothetical protein ACD_47C00263G0001 [uncultured bacterium]